MFDVGEVSSDSNPSGETEVFPVWEINMETENKKSIILVDLIFIIYDLIYALILCRRPESNRHVQWDTAPSRQRVYQFHHFG